MKILILSDLHVELAPFMAPRREDLDYDVVILAGDIHDSHRLVTWIRRESQFGTEVPVVVVPGNHEYYGHAWQPALAKMRADAQGTNVQILDRDEVIIDGVRFLGATMWTSYDLYKSTGVSVEAAMAEALLGMNDYRRIKHVDDGQGHFVQGRKGETRRFMPEDALREHGSSSWWLHRRLAETDCRKIVVVTHHAPSPLSIADRFKGDSLNPCFASEFPCTYFFDAVLWVHGHMHDSADYVLDHTRVLCNPRGYRLFTGAFENDHFDRHLVVDV